MHEPHQPVDEDLHREGDEAPDEAVDDGLGMDDGAGERQREADEAEAEGDRRPRSTFRRMSANSLCASRACRSRGRGRPARAATDEKDEEVGQPRQRCGHVLPPADRPQRSVIRAGSYVGSNADRDAEGGARRDHEPRCRSAGRECAAASSRVSLPCDIRHADREGRRSPASPAPPRPNRRCSAASSGVITSRRPRARAKDRSCPAGWDRRRAREGDRGKPGALPARARHRPRPTRALAPLGCCWKAGFQKFSGWWCWQTKKPASGARGIRARRRG